MRHLCRAFLTILLAVSLFPVGAKAAPSFDEIRFFVENDFFDRFGSHTDRYYTNGLRLELSRVRRSADSDFLPGISHRAWCNLLCTNHDGKIVVTSGFAFGQNMYTPEDITNPAPQPFDRPWAGLLYGSRTARIVYKAESLGAQKEDRLELLAGVVGPAALAGETQIAFHDLIGADRPNGWANQLRNEPVLWLRYQTALRWPQENDRANADVIPRVRANLGNAMASVEAEVIGRIGKNLSGFGVSENPSLFRLPRSRFFHSFNFFGRAGFRLVAHNIFLDGNMFAANDIRIKRKAFVPEFALGTEWNLVDDLWFTFEHIWRGGEFESLGREAPVHQFGAITLSVRRNQ